MSMFAEQNTFSTTNSTGFKFRDPPMDPRHDDEAYMKWLRGTMCCVLQGGKRASYRHPAPGRFLLHSRPHSLDV